MSAKLPTPCPAGAVKPSPPSPPPLPRGDLLSIIRELLINRHCPCGGWSCDRCAVSVEEAQRLVPDLRDNIDRDSTAPPAEPQQKEPPPAGSAPYWLVFALAEHVKGDVCRRGIDPCPSSGDCITEWCVPCAARSWIRDQRQRMMGTAPPAEPQQKHMQTSTNITQADIERIAEFIRAVLTNAVSLGQPCNLDISRGYRIVPSALSRNDTTNVYQPDGSLSLKLEISRLPDSTLDDEWLASK